jgi:hypothetical protein
VTSDLENICITIIVVSLCGVGIYWIWQYYKTKREFIKNGYSEENAQTIQYEKVWVKK